MKENKPLLIQIYRNLRWAGPRIQVRKLAGNTGPGPSLHTARRVPSVIAIPKRAYLEKYGYLNSYECYQGTYCKISHASNE